MKSFLACLFLIIIGALIFGAVLKGIWGNIPAESLKDKTEYSLRDRGRYLLTQNLIEHQTFALTREQANLAAPDAGYYKGKWFELYPPGLSILAIPFYIVGLRFNLSFVATFVMGGIFAIGILIFTFLIARQILKMPYWASILASIIFGFSSNSLGYSTSLFQHHASAFFILASFYAVYQYKIHKKWGFILGFFIWASYGLVIFLDYPNAILMLPVMIYFLIVSINIKKVNDRINLVFRPAIIITSVFFILITALHLYYNYVNFGSATKLSGSLIGFREGVDKALDKGGSLNDNLKKLSQKKNPVNSFKETSIANGAFELFIAPDRGLFIFSPVFILAFVGVFYAASRMDLEKGTLISIAAVTIFFYASWGDPYGGWAFGPRYLITALPFLALFVSYFLSVNSHKIVSKIVAFLLIGISAAISMLGAVTTNATPPQSEAVWLNSHYQTGTHYGIQYAFDFLMSGKTSSFVYTYFLHNRMSLLQYYELLLGGVMVVFTFVLFVMPVLGLIRSAPIFRRKSVPDKVSPAFVPVEHIRGAKGGAAEREIIPFERKYHARLVSLRKNDGN